MTWRGKNMIDDCDLKFGTNYYIFQATMGVTGLGRRDDGACGVVAVGAEDVRVCGGGGGGSGFVHCTVWCVPKTPRRKTWKRFAVTCWKLIPRNR